MDNNTQTQLGRTPLMEAAIAVINNRLKSYSPEADVSLFQGIIDAYESELYEAGRTLTGLETTQSEPRVLVPLNFDPPFLAEDAEVEKYQRHLCDLINSFGLDGVHADEGPIVALHQMRHRISGTAVYENRALREFEQRLCEKLMIALMDISGKSEASGSDALDLIEQVWRAARDKEVATEKKMITLISSVLDFDPFVSDFSTPEEGLKIVQAELNRFKEKSLQLDSELRAEREKSASLLAQINDTLADQTDGLDRVEPVRTEPVALEPKGPEPVKQKVDGRKKPAGDAHLSDMAKLFNQKSVPSLGDLKQYLPQVAQLYYGDGLESITTIGDRIKVSRSNAAEIVRVVKACRDASQPVDMDQFMDALREVAG